MKRATILTAVLVAMSAVWPAAGADAVEPQSISGLRMLRDVPNVVSTTNIVYVQGASFRFTNCICYADALGVVTQGLDGVTVEVGLGNSTTSTWYTMTVADAANGTWWGDAAELPSFASVFWQLRLTDSTSQTNIYYYQQGILSAAPHL